MVFVRKFVVLVVAALAAWIPAPASAVSWTVTPGGDFTATGADAIQTINYEDGVSLDWGCTSFSMPGVASTSGNPVAVIPETSGISGVDCNGAFGFYVELIQIGDWEMHAASYDPVSDVVTGTIPGAAFSWLGPGCEADFGGTLDFRYHNTSGQLEILPNPTLDVTYVDPNNACLGLLDDVDHVTLDATLSVTPAQRIVAS